MFGAATLRIITLSIITLSIITISIMTFSIITLSIITLSIIILCIITLSIISSKYILFYKIALARLSRFISMDLSFLRGEIVLPNQVPQNFYLCALYSNLCALNLAKSI